MSREIDLGRGYVAIVDDDDYDWLTQYRWRLLGDPEKRRTLYATSWAVKRPKTTFMHRLIMGAEPGQVVDHINGEGLDNRRENLRVCTHRQNQQNRRRSVNNKTGYKGVIFHENRYRASIQLDGKQSPVGAFRCPLKAARAYDVAALKHYGEFANLNFSRDRDWLFPHEHDGEWPIRKASPVNRDLFEAPV